GRIGPDGQGPRTTQRRGQGPARHSGRTARGTAGRGEASMSGRGGHANGTGVPEPDFGDTPRQLGADASRAVESAPVEGSPGVAGETTNRRAESGTSSVPSFIRRLIRSRREVERTLEVVRRAARFLFQSQLPRMAAALSYRTIFGLVPTLVIAIAVLGSFAS